MRWALKPEGGGRGLPHPPRPRQAAARPLQIEVVATSISNQTDGADLAELVIQHLNLHPDGRDKGQIVQLILGEKNTVSHAALSALGRDFIGDENARALDGVALLGGKALALKTDDFRHTVLLTEVKFLQSSWAFDDVLALSKAGTEEGDPGEPVPLFLI